MARHIFKKVGDGPWEDTGNEELLEKYGVGTFRSEEVFLNDLMALANISGEQPILLEIREVPDNTVEVPS